MATILLYTIHCKRLKRTYLSVAFLSPRELTYQIFFFVAVYLDCSKYFFILALQIKISCVTFGGLGNYFHRQFLPILCRVCEHRPFDINNFNKLAANHLRSHLLHLKIGIYF